MDLYRFIGVSRHLVGVSRHFIFVFEHLYAFPDTCRRFQTLYMRFQTLYGPRPMGQGPWAGPMGRARALTCPAETSTKTRPGVFGSPFPKKSVQTTVNHRKIKPPGTRHRIQRIQRIQQIHRIQRKRCQAELFGTWVYPRRGSGLQCRLMQKKPLQETKALEMPKMD